MSDLSIIQHNIEFSYLQDQSYSEFITENRRIFRCTVPLCGKTFKFKSEMNRHLASHSSLRPFPCLHPNCGKTFKRQDALNNHIRLHEQTTPYICSEEGCGAEFTTKSALRYHILKHTGERVFHCDHPGCDRAFMTLAQLKQHMKASTYHKKLRTPSSTSEGSLISYYSPHSGDAIELPVIKYNLTNEFEMVQKKLKQSNAGMIFRSKMLENQSNCFDHLKDIYDNPTNEISQVNLNEGFLKQLSELNNKENESKYEVNTNLYNALKSILDDNTTVFREVPIDKKIVEPVQNPINTTNMVNNGLPINNSVGSLEPRREKSLDFDSWLQTEGFQNLYA